MAWAVAVRGIGYIASGVTSIVGTAITPVLEMLYQRDIIQAGVACQALNSTLFTGACTNVRNVASIAGNAVPYLGTITGVASAAFGILSHYVFPCGTKPYSEQEGQEGTPLRGKKPDVPCWQVGGIYLGSFGGFSLTIAGIVGASIASNHAESTALTLGYECVNRTIVNATACAALESSLQGSNTTAAVWWVVYNVASATLGFTMLRGMKIMPNPSPGSFLRE